MESSPPAVSRRRIVGGASTALAATLLGAPAFVRAAPGQLKIGFVSPQTGPLAGFGESDRFILEGIRKAIGSGIRIGSTTVPVEIVVRDTQSSANRASEVTADLILKQKVNLVLASSTPDVTNPASDQCELNATPCISTICPWQAWMLPRGGKPEKGFGWTYHFFWGLDDIATVFMNMWSTASTNRTVGGLYPKDADGDAWNSALPPMLKAKGFKSVDPGRYPNLSADFSAMIATLKREHAEIITGAPLPPDFKTLWTQAAAQGYRPKIATVAKALLFPSSVEALGELGDGLSSEVWWSPAHPFKSSLTTQSARELANSYSAATGKQWTQPIGFVHALFEVATDVLKRAKEVGSKASIRDAIKATSLDTVVGKVDFAGSKIQNVALTPLVAGQWVRGTKYRYDLQIVDNSHAPRIPATAKLKLL
jgi:branched-chain amino acid transport system substrate-binding protein